MGGAASSTGWDFATFVRTHSNILQRVILGSVGAVAALGAFYGLGLLGLYNVSYAGQILPFLFEGFLTTAGLVAIVIPLGFLLGFIFGNARVSHSWLVRAVSTTYVEFFRGMPPTVLIWFAFIITVVLIAETPFLFARIQDPLSFGILIAVFSLAAHSSSYQAEIIRAGILSVPAGQREAAEAIGMTKGTVMINITLPQMFRVSLPALGNEFASVIKDTSIISIVGALDLTFRGQNIISRAVSGGGVSLDAIFIVWIEVAILYFALTFTVTRSLQYLERRYRVPGLEAAQL